MAKKITLRKYYKTKHWKQLRNKYAWGDDAHCEICNAHRWENYKIGPKKGQRKPKSVNHLHLHHKHYDTMFKESREDLILLCDTCHKFGHLIEKIKKRNDMYKKLYDDYKISSNWAYKKR